MNVTWSNRTLSPSTSQVSSQIQVLNNYHCTSALYRYNMYVTSKQTRTMEGAMSRISGSKPVIGRKLRAGVVRIQSWKAPLSAIVPSTKSQPCIYETYALVQLILKLNENEKKKEKKTQTRRRALDPSIHLFWWYLISGRYRVSTSYMYIHGMSKELLRVLYLFTSRYASTEYYKQFLALSKYFCYYFDLWYNAGTWHAMLYSLLCTYEAK